MLPSAKTLDAWFPGHGKDIRNMLKANRSDILMLSHAARYYSGLGFNTIPTYLLRLTAINEIIGGSGIEYIGEGSNKNSPSFDYINTGDMYNPTIVRFSDGRYRVKCVADIIERGNYN